MPLVAMRASVRDVLPWSTWASIHIYASSAPGPGVESGYAYVSDVVRRALEGDQLVAGDDGHIKN